MAPHQDYWYHITDDQLMKENIARHKDQEPLQELDELKNTIEYGCSDKRLHPLHHDHSEEASKEAEKRIDDDFENLPLVPQDHVEEHKVLPYMVLLHCLASRYLGGGLVDPTYKDDEFPYRSSPQFSLMLWNLGNGCRNRFVLFQKDFKNLFHTSTTNWMKTTTKSTRTSPSTTIISSMSSKTLEDIFS